MEKCWHPLFKYVMEVKSEYVKFFNTEEYDFNVMLDFLREHDSTLPILKVFEPLEITCNNNLALFKYKNFIELSDMDYDYTFWDLYDHLYLECRSVVFDLKNECIVLAPQTKFKNCGEDDNEWSMFSIRRKLEAAEKIEITNKLDGSNQNFRFYNGEYIGTGSQAVNPELSWRLRDGYSMLTDNYKKMLKDYPDYTFMFEFISVKNAIVVHYTKEQEGLYLFGMRNVNDGKEKTYEEVLEIGHKYDVKTTEIYNDSFDDIMGKLDDYKCDEKEGWVIALWNDGDVFKAKLKVNDYVNMHKILSKNISPNAVINVIEAGNYDDLYSKVPSGYRDILNDMAMTVYQYIMLMENATYAYYDKLKKYLDNNNFDNERKEAFEWIQKEIPKFLRGYVANVYCYGGKLNFLKNRNNKYMKMGEIEKLIEKVNKLNIEGE